MRADKARLGTKLACAACAVRFYDLGRSPAVCPVCHAEQPPPRPAGAYPARTAGRRWGQRGAVASPAAPAADAAAADDEVAEDESPLLDPADDDEDDEAEVAAVTDSTDEP